MDKRTKTGWPDGETEVNTETAANNAVLDFLKDHLVTLLIWLVLVGVGYGVYEVKSAWTESRIANIEKEIESINTNGPEFGRALKAVVDTHTNQINTVIADARALTRDISDIKANQAVQAQRLNEMDKKLDTLLVQTRKQ